VAKFVGAVAFLLIPFFVTPNKGAWLLGLIAAAGLVVYGARDLIAPVRLSADPNGVTVASGYSGHRRLTWSEIDRVRLDRRRRFGANSDFLEVDAGHSLYFFSRYDLGVDPSDALAEIRAIRRGMAH
jgi:hypothetical protein